MEKLTCHSCALFLALLLIATQEVNCAKIQKLFVFGDSYVDTGNLGNLARSWYEPYGMTFPHRPTGRFCDGRLITDYIAAFLKLKSPIPYKFKRMGPQYFSCGMNFAIAGSGVFDTGMLQPNLSMQINRFQEQIAEGNGVFTNIDVESSVAIVSVNGNDYTHYSKRHDDLDLFMFVSNVTSQIKTELRRLSKFGLKKVVVSNLSPLECTPDITRIRHNYTQCDEPLSLGTYQHNSLLVDAVKELNAERNNTEFLILDLYSAFKSIIRAGKGDGEFKHNLRPCCEGNTADISCGLIGKNNEKLYSICSNPQDYFYFDSVHPTQAGWTAVFALIKPWLTDNL